MQHKFNFADRKSFSRMTNVNAQEIVTYMAELEFPRIMEASLQFALFKASFRHPSGCVHMIILIVAIDLWYSHDI